MQKVAPKPWRVLSVLFLLVEPSKIMLLAKNARKNVIESYSIVVTLVSPLNIRVPKPYTLNSSVCLLIHTSRKKPTSWFWSIPLIWVFCDIKEPLIYHVPPIIRKTKDHKKGPPTFWSPSLRLRHPTLNPTNPLPSAVYARPPTS